MARMIAETDWLEAYDTLKLARARSRPVDSAALERFVVELIYHLHADEFADRLLASLEPADSGDRSVRLETLLARVLAHEAVLPNARSVGMPPLEAFASLPPQTRRLRFLYCHSLAIGLGGAGQSATALPHDLATDDPIYLAAARLQSTRPLAASHRAARQRIDRPLGFCFLALEEARAIDRAATAGQDRALAELATLFDDPFLRAVQPRVYLDLRARHALYLAESHLAGGRGEAWVRQMLAVDELLADGTGDLELQALALEIRAEHGCRSADHGRDDLSTAFELQARALELLVEQPADRRAHSELAYARALRRAPQRWQLATRTLDAALARVATLGDEIDPRLQLGLWHERARVELLRVRMTVSTAEPLASVGLDSTLSSVLVDQQASGDQQARRRMARALDAFRQALAGEADRLERARAWLRRADQLYVSHGTPHLRAERRWLLGRTWVVSQPCYALDHFEAAVGAFEAAGHRRQAAAVVVDILVCLAIDFQLGACPRWLERLAELTAEDENVAHSASDDGRSMVLRGGLDIGGLGTTWVN